jgi:hypothetical protein
MMMYLTDIERLLSSWTERLGNPTLPQSYKDGLNDCLFELNQLVSDTVENEIAAYEHIMEEAHEAA